MGKTSIMARAGWLTIVSIGLGTGLLAQGVPAILGTQPRSTQSLLTEPLLDKGYHQMYNLDFADAPARSPSMKR